MDHGSIATALENMDRFIAECEARVLGSRRAMAELRRQGVELPEADETLDEVLVLLTTMKEQRDALLELLWRGGESGAKARPGRHRRWAH